MPFFCGSLYSCPRQETTLKKIIKNDTNTQTIGLKKEFTIEDGIPPSGCFLFRKRRAPYAAFSCAGSITLEAALVIPLMVLAFAAIMQIMLLMNIQLKIQSTLEQQAVKAAGYTCLVDSLEGFFLEGMDSKDYGAALNIAENGVTELLIKNMVVDKLGEAFFKTPWLAGGKDGLQVIITPWLEEDTIDIVLYYQLQPIFNFFGIGKIPVVARARLRQWTGTTRVVLKKEEAVTEGTVYVTPNGTVYHTFRDCTYLSVSLTAVRYDSVKTRRNASGGKYYPCPVCCRDPAAETTVYVSRYGERYHEDRSCHTIYHNVTEISFDEVGNRKLCSKCRTRGAAAEQ